VDAAKVFRIGRPTGSPASDNEGIGSAAFPGIAGLILQGVACGERGGVFHVDIGEDANFLCANFTTEPKKVFGDSRNDPLICDASADEDIDADKLSSDCMGDGHRPDAVIT
jgi:hypothetical protein